MAVVRSDEIWLLNRDKFGIKVDQSRYFGASGLFADDNIVFMTKVIYKAKTGGLDTSSSTLYGDISNWMDGFQDAAGFLQRQVLNLRTRNSSPGCHPRIPSIATRKGGIEGGPGRVCHQ